MLPHDWEHKKVDITYKLYPYVLNLGGTEIKIWWIEIRKLARGADIPTGYTLCIGNTK